MSKNPQADAVDDVSSVPQETTEAQPDYKELYQRTLADQENARKRGDQERMAFTKFALEGFVNDLLPIVDNFDRATEHVPEAQKSDAWTTGILHIQKQLTSLLEQYGVTEIPTKAGEKFDHNLHEAIGAEAKEGMEEDHIISIKTKGYRLHDRLLRPTQVIVSSK